MQERHLKSWAEFRKVIEEIRNNYGHHEISIGDDQVHRQKNTVLFRGQQSANWQLKTTLERKTQKTYSVLGYLYEAIKIVHELEAHSGKRWNLSTMDDIRKEMEEKQDSLFGPYFPHYNYLVYLRHHGYPSPLLDWSASPYIAAYFAMSESSDDENIAVYAYIYSTDGSKDFRGGDSVINIYGPLVSTDKRHFMQQAWYTTATKWSDEKSKHEFCSHHDVFNHRVFSHQDILIKITIPSSERKIALQDLHDHNVNHFTLFQTEDSLIKALSIKNFDLEE